MSAPVDDTTFYRWPRPVVLRWVGMLSAGLGLVWIVSVALLAWIGAGPGAALYAVGLSTTGAGLVAGLFLLWRPPLVVEMAADRYRLYHLRGGGARNGRWLDVESAQTESTSNGQVIVVRLSNGERSLVPLALLGARAVEAEREIHERLNTAHGYRPLAG